jgi:hypothetical protein
VIVPLLIAALATGEPVFPLPRPLTDFGTPIANLTRTQALALRDRPMAGLTATTGFPFVKDGKQNRIVTSCRSLDAANRDGYAPQDNAVNKTSQYMTVTCGLLDAVIAAHPRAAGRTQAPIGLDRLDRISMAALPAFPSEENVPSPAALARRDRRSIAQFARDEHCTVTEASTLELRLKCNGYLLALTTVLQADLDGDGRDDLVVSPYIASLEGSFSYAGDDLILARRAAGALFVPRELPAVAS